MPKITVHIEMDSFEEASNFFSQRAASPVPTPAAPSMGQPGGVGSAASVISASSSTSSPAPATASAAAPSGASGSTDPLAAKRKETTDAMMAYVARGEGRSAKTAKDIQTQAGVLKGIREATDAQLDTLLLAYSNG